jgi:hypothetical protein
MKKLNEHKKWVVDAQEVSELKIPKIICEEQRWR